MLPLAGAVFSSVILSSDMNKNLQVSADTWRSYFIDYKSQPTFD
jgi:hypothetical protein